MELLENLNLLSDRYSRPGIAHRDVERAVQGRGADRNLAPIGELDGIAHKVEQHLRDAPLVAAADREIGQDVEPEAKLLLSRESTAVTTPCTTSPSE